MSSLARRLRRSQPGRRASVASMIAVFVIGLFAVAPVAAVPAVPGPGYQDFQYNVGPESAPGGDAVTGGRNQSKLWFNDGKWWGMLFDKTSSKDGTYRIQSLNMATQTWTSSATAPAADTRNKSHADVLSDGNTLWVVSSHDSGTNIPPNGDLQVYKYTYAAGKYTLVNGFPKVVAQGGTDPATIAKSPNGHIYVAYTKNDAAPATTAHVLVVSSIDTNGTNWNTPFELTGGSGSISTTDVAAVVPVNNGVGVFWSNQNALDAAYYFQIHLDSSAFNVWQSRETAYNGIAGADGHMSVKADGAGQVLAAVKTKGSTTQVLIGVLRRTTGGTWTMHEVADSVGSPDPTRPILVIDGENNQADVFMTNQTNGGIITRRTAALSDLDFGAPSAGTAFIQSAADPAISDATSTKQVTTAQSGLIVLASDRTLAIRRYLHGCAGSACPVAPTAAFSGTPLTGEGPLNVTFTDASTGSPASWLWTFGDGATSTLQNPSHSYNPGTYDVSLKVTNILGTNTLIKTGYVVVTVPPGATFTAITPTRVLDTRVGNGLSGAVPRRDRSRLPGHQRGGRSRTTRSPSPAT